MTRQYFVHLRVFTKGGLGLGLGYTNRDVDHIGWPHANGVRDKGARPSEVERVQLQQALWVLVAYITGVIGVDGMVGFAADLYMRVLVSPQLKLAARCQGD